MFPPSLFEKPGRDEIMSWPKNRLAEARWMNHVLNQSLYTKYLNETAQQRAQEILEDEVKPLTDQKKIDFFRQFDWPEAGMI